MTENKPDDAPDRVRDDGSWTGAQRESLVELIGIQPDLSEIVEDRTQRRKLIKFGKKLTHAVVEFLKYAAMIGGAIAIVKAALAGWSK